MATRSALCRALLCAGLLGLAAPVPALDDEALGFERTPPRLSFLDGEVSFFRPGAEDWTPARVNIALAAGDELYTGARANLELQIGARAFARAGEHAQLGLTSLEPDYLQFRVTGGHVSLDVRSLKVGHTLELDTPNAAFRIERSGYYRVAVNGEATTFTSRRGGQALLTTASGDTTWIAASEQVIVRGADAPQVESYAAPELDAWDRWNYARTDDQLDAVSARYVSSDVYGVDDLDQYGDWRLVPTYGAIWVPRSVAVGWVPYSSGRWLYDPYYGWTWLDDAPWGWAPYHYGRWVYVSGYWGWCPGPIVRRVYYAPALVAFYGGGGFSLGVTFGTPWVGWVALGYGEPLLPWWGPARVRHHAHWAGWGGPRYVNRGEWRRGAPIDARDLRDYEHAHRRDAIVSVKREHFGRRSRAGDGRFTRAEPKKFAPLGRELDVSPDPTSLVPDLGAAKRPPRESWQRAVVATREPRAERSPEFEAQRAAWKAKAHPASKRPAADAAKAPELPDAPPTRVAAPAREETRGEAPKRPPFGRRGEDLRRIPPPAPRFEAAERSDAPERAARTPEVPAPERTMRTPEAAAPEQRRAVERPAPAGAPATRRERAAETRASEPARPRAEAPPERPRTPTPERVERPAARPRPESPPRELPGEPANRVYRQGRRQSGGDAREPERARPSQGGERSRDSGKQRGQSGDPRPEERGSSRPR